MWGFSGDPFTWARGNTRKRLDRALCNLDWRLRFEEIVINHLPKLKSDHSPLLMNFDIRRQMNRRRRPFRFEAIWLTHPSFNNLILDNWRPNQASFPSQLRELQGTLKQWNQEVFGNIFYQKKILWKKLKNLEKRMIHGRSDHLINMQKSTWKMYEDILAKVELMWY